MVSIITVNPFKSLTSAVILNAIEEYVSIRMLLRAGGFGHRKRAKLKDKLSGVEDWLFGWDEDDRIGSLGWCCQVVGYEKEVVREEIKRLRMRIMRKHRKFKRRHLWKV